MGDTADHTVTDDQSVLTIPILFKYTKWKGRKEELTAPSRGGSSKGLPVRLEISVIPERGEELVPPTQKELGSANGDVWTFL